MSGRCSNATECVKFQLFHALARSQLAQSLSYLNGSDVIAGRKLIGEAHSNLLRCKSVLLHIKCKKGFYEDDFVNASMSNDLEKEISKRRLMADVYLLKIDADFNMQIYINFDAPDSSNRERACEVINLYKKAIHMANGKFPEFNAELLSILGLICEKILKNETKARLYFYECFDLCKSIHSKTLRSQTWYIR